MIKSKLLIPRTGFSPLRYITGTTALNIPSENGSGDWHYTGAFFLRRKNKSPYFVAGEGLAINTKELFGLVGIEDMKAKLNRLGIRFKGDKALVANHTRACADLVIAATGISEKTAIESVILDDWIQEDRDIEQVSNLLEGALLKITNNDTRERVEKWMKINLK